MGSVTQFDWVPEAFAETAFTVFDTETTGLDPKLNRIVEIGAIRFDARGVIARFNVLIRTGVAMPPEITKINGITDAMLASQPAPNQVFPDFLRFIGDTPLLAHNAPFDVSFVNEELARLGLPALKNRVIDTRIFAKELFPGLPKYALQDLAARFGIDAREAHRAEDDARVCMELFLACLSALREKNAPLESRQKPTPIPQPAGDARSEGGIHSESARGAVQDEAEQEDLFAEEMDDEDFLEDEQV